MGISGRRLAGLAILALAVASCSSSGEGGKGSTPSPGLSASRAPTASASTGPTQSQPEPPAAPLYVGSGNDSESGIECEGGDGGTCVLDLSWHNSAGPDTRFRIYWAMSGEDESLGTLPCSGAVDEADPLEDTEAGATSVHIEMEGLPIGVGAPCFWVSAFNDAGESELVASAGNWGGEY
jgi:hypothetical protein